VARNLSGKPKGAIARESVELFRAPGPGFEPVFGSLTGLLRPEGKDMSRYMQIDIRLLPIYGAGGLKGAFPNLFEFLSTNGYDRVIDKEPPLYEMVEVMIRIKNDPHVRPGSIKPLVSKLDELIKVRDQARESLLARRLDELDRHLYRLEDLFGDLDGNLV